VCLGGIPAYAADNPAPQLMLAATSNGTPIFLEDYRGLITVFCFFDDSYS
jgi:hypothetical protein